MLVLCTNQPSKGLTQMSDAKRIIEEAAENLRLSKVEIERLLAEVERLKAALRANAADVSEIKKELPVVTEGVKTIMAERDHAQLQIDELKRGIKSLCGSVERVRGRVYLTMTVQTYDSVRELLETGKPRSMMLGSFETLLEHLAEYHCIRACKQGGPHDQVCVEASKLMRETDEIRQPNTPNTGSVHQGSGEGAVQMSNDRQFAGLLTMLMPELCDCKGTPACVPSCRWVKFTGRALRELAPSKVRETGGEDES